MKKELFKELLASVKQARAIEKGKLRPSRTFRLNPDAQMPDVASRLRKVFGEKVISNHAAEKLLGGSRQK